jgi:hypothetical protein
MAVAGWSPLAGRSTLNDDPSGHGLFASKFTPVVDMRRI